MEAKDSAGLLTQLTGCPFMPPVEKQQLEGTPPCRPQKAFKLRCSKVPDRLSALIVEARVRAMEPVFKSQPFNREGKFRLKGHS